jgi:hypothetical protein
VLNAVISAFEGLLQCFDCTRGVRACSCTVVLVGPRSFSWITALLTIPDTAFVSSMRHCLVILKMPPGNLVVACDFSEPPTVGHAMVCNAHMMGMTSAQLDPRSLSQHGLLSCVKLALGVAWGRHGERRHAGCAAGIRLAGHICVSDCSDAYCCHLLRPAGGASGTCSSIIAGTANNRKYGRGGQAASVSFALLSMQSYQHMVLRIPAPERITLAHTSSYHVHPAAQIGVQVMVDESRLMLNHNPNDCC